MAYTILPQPKPRTPAKRRKLDPERVFQAYIYECETRGKRGAFRRVAAIYNYSPDSIEKLIHRLEAQQREREEQPPELVYVAPPNAYPEPKPAPQLVIDNAETTPKNQGMLIGNIMSNPEFNVPSSSASMPNAEDAEHRQLERAETPTTPAETPIDEPRPEPELPPIRDPFDEPLEPRRVPDYLRDPLNPTRPATVDPSEIRSPGRMQPTPVVTRVVRLSTEKPRQDIYSRLATLNLDTLAGPELAILAAVFLILLCVIATR